MPSTVVSLLARLDEAELRKMQSALEADGARVDAERARINVELDQVREALARRARPVAKGRNPGRRPARRPGETQQRILDAVARLPQPVSPAQVIANMEEHGVTGNRGTIHNAIGRLVKTGQLVRLGEGQYKLASTNGSSPESSVKATSSGDGGYERQGAPTLTDGLG